MKTKDLSKQSWVYLRDNFHKFSEDKKIKIALCLLTRSKKPNKLIVELRDRETPDYRKWRKEVFIRNNFTCSKCGEHGGVLNAHHVERWVDNKAKRYDVNNGITLCTKCHKAEHHSKLEF